MSRTPLVAKPTEYAGRLFRSRTEARWAVFLDALGLAWEYESRGFDLVVSGKKRSYLPDFYLPTVWGQSGQGVWLEIKGAQPTSAERALAQSLAKQTRQDCYIASGGVPSPSQFTGSRVILSPGRIEGFHPRARRGVPESGKPTSAECWTECECGALGIQRNGLAGRMLCDTSSCGPKTLSVTSRKRRATGRLQSAMIAATSSRFEHGEQGAMIRRAPLTSGAPDAESRIERAELLLREALELLAQAREDAAA